MRRARNLWPGVVEFGALLGAARRAARGKRAAHSVARFLERAEPEVLALQRDLGSDVWRPGPTTRFEIRDPKRRTITVVPFRDQVVHHALIAQLEPVFERRMIPDSYACRVGKGSHAALRRARRFVRCHRFFLKLDVRKFFASVDHTVAMETLERIVKDRRVLSLCARVLGSGPGLPIGSLTSQWFANMVLDRLDHFVKEQLRIPGYVRYMDDLALFADSKQMLRGARDSVAAFLDDPLKLRLKERATLLAPASEGLPFLGWHLFRGTVRVRRENLARYLWRLRLRRYEYEQGRRSAESFIKSVAAVFELLRHGDTRALRRRWCRHQHLDL